MNYILTTNYVDFTIKQLLVEVDALPAIKKEVHGKEPERILCKIHKSMLRNLYIKFLCMFVYDSVHIFTRTILKTSSVPRVTKNCRSN